MTVRARDLKVGDVIYHRGLAEGGGRRIMAALDGQALVVVGLVWPGDEEEAGVVWTRQLGGGRGPTLRPRGDDLVERGPGL